MALAAFAMIVTLAYDAQSQFGEAHRLKDYKAISMELMKFHFVVVTQFT